ncbi:MAG: cyclase [Desulfuromonas sp.]|mgnify:CR=1 FL=1|uniref:cyclase family protein n=1 Tax=Desulfuromonas sp. TaxID=892 RepID=UPI000CB10C99|nr:cyclase family protein [Desulfuromonas sp.]PLX83509.1 MAG: cyclase [Desulfuromonas sp.]
MPLHDISVPLSPALPRYPGDPPFERMEETVPGTPESFRLSRLRLGSHAGTHLDAPAHLLGEEGTVGDIPLETLVGPCMVVDLAHRRGDIRGEELRKLKLKGQGRLLLRTRNSLLWSRSDFSEDYDGLTPDGAAYLVEIGVRLVGIDYLSIEPFRSTGAVHRTLLEAGVTVLEGLNLSGVKRGPYELICLPLRLDGAEGAPCRAVLRAPEAPPTREEHHTRWPR